MVGDITDIAFTKVNSYSKTVKGNTVLYNLAFRLNHQLPEDGRIDISLAYGSFVSRSYAGCYIVADVPDRNDGTYPGCVANG
jgi:hypothetical protein